jgi:predicted AAA+ superfamily ATPase
MQKAWEKRSVIWLAGVRRVGKTYLCRSLPEIEYFDCELPRTHRIMEDPECPVLPRFFAEGWENQISRPSARFLLSG